MPPLYDDGISPAEIYERHRAWGDETIHAVAAKAALVAPFTNSRDPERRAHVGRSRVAAAPGDLLH